MSRHPCSVVLCQNTSPLPAVPLPGPEVFSIKLFGHAMAEFESLGVRVAKVKAGVDTRPQDFIFQVPYIGKCVRSAGHTAVDRQPDVWDAEVQLQRFGK